MVGKTCFNTPDGDYMECVLMNGWQEVFVPPPDVFDMDKLNGAVARDVQAGMERALEWLGALDLDLIYEGYVGDYMSIYQYENTEDMIECKLMNTKSDIEKDYDDYFWACSKVLSNIRAYPDSIIILV